MKRKKKHGFLYGFWNSLLVFTCLGVLIIFFTWAIGSGKLDRNRYPLMYREIVDKYCGDYGVDRYLVFSVIRTESFFTPDAVSDKGAVGLMQIMPDTGEWIAEKLKRVYISDKLYVVNKGVWTKHEQPGRLFE